MKIALLTSCTVSRTVEPLARIGDMPVCSTMKELLSEWITKVEEFESAKENLHSPGEMYMGLSMTATTEMAQDIGHNNIWIVTGGMGLSNLVTPIVPYDFTSDKNIRHNAPSKVQNERFLPGVWWQLINQARHGSQTPVADLVRKYDIVVGALPKAFIKYILLDLSALSEEELKEKVFIPIPRSMLGGVPKALQAGFVPYGRDFTNMVSFSRTDKPHRVVQRFLNLAGEDFKDIAKVAHSIEKNALEENSSGGVAAVNYDKMFEEHPELVEFDDPGIARKQAKAMGLKVGGKHQFAGAWRGARGTLDVKVTKKDLKASTDALQDLLKDTSLTARGSDDALLEKLGIFVASVREIDPNIIFTARTVTQWAEKMHPDDEALQQTNKVSYVLTYNAKFLGLETVDTGSATGFRLVK